MYQQRNGSAASNYQLIYFANLRKKNESTTLFAVFLPICHQLFYKEVLFCVLFADLQQSFAFQYPPGDARDDYRHYDGDEETVRRVLHAIDEVHAEHRGDECWEHHNDTHRGEGTHYGVHVVVDDARVGVHGRLQNVRVDAGGFPCLRHLNVDILNQVGVALIDL